MKTPKKVQELAAASGFNRAQYAGTLDGVNYFSLGIVDKNGDPLPSGLPAFVMEAGGRYSLVDGPAGLDVCNRLFRDK